MKALEQDSAYQALAAAFVRVRFDTENGRAKGTTSLYVTRNTSYFLVLDAAGAEWQRVANPTTVEVVRGAMQAPELEGRKALTGLPLLLRLLASDDKHKRSDALHYISALGANAAAAVPALVRYLELDPAHARAGERLWALKALGSIGPGAKAALPLLMRGALAGAKARSDAAAKSLGQVDPLGKQVLPTLILVLAEHPPARIGASQAAVHMGAHAAPLVPALMRALAQTSSRAEEVYFARALGAVGPKAKAAIPLLEKLAAREPPKRKNVHFKAEAQARHALSLIRR